MKAPGSFSWTSVSPDDCTAVSVFLDKQVFKMAALYFACAVVSMQMSMLDSWMNRFHWISHDSNESLYSSKSNGGGLP